MRRLLLWLMAALTIGLPAGGPAAAAEAAWRRYDYADLGLSFESPGAPQRSSVDVPISDGVTLKAHTFILSADADQAIVIMATDYSSLGLRPEQLADPAVQNKFFDAGVQGALKQPGTVLLSQTPITHQGFPGRAFTMRSTEKQMASSLHAVLVGSVVYVVIGTGREPAGPSPALSRVVRSLTLTARP